MKLLTKKLEKDFEKQGDTSELETNEIKISNARNNLIVSKSFTI